MSGAGVLQKSGSKIGSAPPERAPGNSAMVTNIKNKLVSKQRCTDDARRRLDGACREERQPCRVDTEDTVEYEAVNDRNGSRSAAAAAVDTRSSLTTIRLPHMNLPGRQTSDEQPWVWCDSAVQDQGPAFQSRYSQQSTQCYYHGNY